ncbi:MAG: xanthine dehydrogenase small subunit [Robiginitomaculum sp.]|nr:xanthine dehydrogenase small subunit [Robiginitomaculum sp.]
MSQLQTINFVLNGQQVNVSMDDTQQSLLSFLRDSVRKTGTKEGCNEGDCGACTVVIGKANGDKVKYKAVNACILLLAQVDNCEVITVEGVQGDDGALHPVQQALVDYHGSQCGFCTPGFVMSLYAHYRNRLPADRQTLKDTLAGNLCRCTGYGPILAAGQAMYNYPEPKGENTASDAAVLTQNDAQIQNSTAEIFSPKTEEQLQELLQKFPDATLWAGGTDTGLWLTKKLQHLPRIILLGKIATLNFVKDRKQGLSIGAMASYSDVIGIIAEKWPAFGEVIRRTGSTQIRNSGTIGGNIANGSPIGDMAPILIVLGAKLVLRKQGQQREILLEDFFIEYGKQDLAAGEYLAEILISKQAEQLEFRTWKISKRFDQDISAVLGAFSWEDDEDKIANMRIAFGGMAATPKRAKATEDVLRDNIVTEALLDKACQALNEDFTPLSDMRASSSYRQEIAASLLRKAFANKPVSLAKADEVSS